MEIIFIRHGATAGNLERRYIGRTDEPLCPLGVEQVEKLKGLFDPDYLFVSPMLRTRQTAEILFPNMIAKIVEDLRETDFGIFEGKTADELQGNIDYVNWLESMCLDPIPGGEKVEEFKNRCCKAFSDCVGNLPKDCKAAFVVHGGVIMSTLERFCKQGKSFYDYHIKNGEYICCKFEDGVLTKKASLV